MRSIWLVLASVVFSVAVCVVIFNRHESGASSEPVFERVAKSGTLRCGYNIVPPFFQKDPNTGEFSGFTYEIMKSIAKTADLKLEWTAEIGVGDAPTALNTNKIDAVCVPLLLSPVRAKTMLPVKSEFYTPISAYARADDKRFDGDLKKINQKDIRISAIDGDFSYDLATGKFPNAKLAALPQTAGAGDAMLQVATKKADIVMMVPEAIAAFNANNKNKLRAVANVPPARIYSEHIFLKAGEYRLQGLLNNAIDTLVNDGEIEKIIAGYNKKFGGQHKAPEKAF